MISMGAAIFVGLVAIVIKINLKTMTENFENTYPSVPPQQ
jgi:hypothetical protein